jgi:1-phosphofructokinase family hexose kinase
MILAAGLTPALQQVLQFDALTLGAVNRAAEVQWCASGKVLNVARALHHLGAPSRALAPAGGATGNALQRDFARLGISARWVEVGAVTRVCTTLLAGGIATELVENARELTAPELEAFLDSYAEEAPAAAVVVLIGSLAPGAPPHYYRALLSRAPGMVILDARGDELLEALVERPFLVKPNREELAHTLHRDLTEDAELLEAMAELNRRGAEWAVVTDGRGPVYARSAEGLYRLRPPQRLVVNPIGCGDCLAAGLAWATWRGLSPIEAVQVGLAAAADKVGRTLPGSLDRAAVEALVSSVEVARMSEPK